MICMLRNITMLKRIASGLVLAIGLTGGLSASAKDASILSASYDISRELFAEINPRFVEKWEAETGGKLKIDQSFAGTDRKSTRLNSSHVASSYAVFCLKKTTKTTRNAPQPTTLAH